MTALIPLDVKVIMKIMMMTSKQRRSNFIPKTSSNEFFSLSNSNTFSSESDEFLTKRKSKLKYKQKKKKKKILLKILIGIIVFIVAKCLLYKFSPTVSCCPLAVIDYQFIKLFRFPSSSQLQDEMRFIRIMISYIMMESRLIEETVGRRHKR